MAHYMSLHTLHTDSSVNSGNTEVFFIFVIKQKVHGLHPSPKLHVSKDLSSQRGMASDSELAHMPFFNSPHTVKMEKMDVVQTAFAGDALEHPTKSENYCLR